MAAFGGPPPIHSLQSSELHEKAWFWSARVLTFTRKVRTSGARSRPSNFPQRRPRRPERSGAAAGIGAVEVGRRGARAAWRRRKAGVPEEVEFKTKPQIALE